jgi:hypothetical protein
MCGVGHSNERLSGIDVDMCSHSINGQDYLTFGQFSALGDLTATGQDRKQDGEDRNGKYSIHGM